MSEIEDTLKKKFGNDIFFAGDQLLDKKQEIISVSPALDLILGGGIPKGSFCVVTGRYKVGKSSLCLHFAKNAQQAGMKVYYFNVEGRLKPRDLSGIPGLETDIEHFEVIGSIEGKILSAEDYIDILLSYVQSKTNCVFILDSVSQLCSKGRHANEVGNRFRDDVPLLLADMTKRVSNVLPITDNIMICITHLIANQGMGHSQWSEASGQKIQYQADVKLKALYQEAYKVKEQQIGQLVHWQCDTTALGTAPCGKTTSLLRYGEGIDCAYELVNMCIDVGLVEKKGSWIKFPNEEKAQGLEKARYKLIEDTDLYKDLQQQLYTILGL